MACERCLTQFWCVALSYRAGNSIWAHEIKINFTSGHLATLRLSLRVFDDKITAIKRASNAITAPTLSLSTEWIAARGCITGERKRHARSREFCSSSGRGERTPVHTPWRTFPQQLLGVMYVELAWKNAIRMCVHIYERGEQMWILLPTQLN